MAKAQIRRGKNMKIGSGWLLHKKRRDPRQNKFEGTLHSVIRIGGKRVAIFTVLKSARSVPAR